MVFLGVQTWSPFVTRKSGHIWQIWAEMTQMLMPKSTKVAQIHLPECNSAKLRQISAKIRRISAKIRQISPCRKRGEAKGDRQKSDQKRQKSDKKGYQKVTETEKK